MQDMTNKPESLNKLEMPSLTPLDPKDEQDVALRSKPREDWKGEDLYKAFTLPLVGKRAQIHSLNDQRKFNGMIVKLETWDYENQYFEARLENSQALIKLGIEKVTAFADIGPNGRNYDDSRRRGTSC